MGSSNHWMGSVILKAAGPGLPVSSLFPGNIPLVEAWDKAAKILELDHAALADLIAAYFHLPRANFEDLDSKARNWFRRVFPGNT